MQLSTNLWLEKGFYIDIDRLEQLRVVGPGDHLYFGMINEKDGVRNYEITKISAHNDTVFLDGIFFGPKVKLYFPVMGDIRTVRSYIYDRLEKVKSFFDVRKKFPDVLLPNQITEKAEDGRISIKFERHFGNDYYGSELVLDNKIMVQKKDSFFVFSNDKPAINFSLRFRSSHFFKQSFFSDLFVKRHIRFKGFNDDKETVQEVLKRAGIEVKHLLNNRKTSGLDYGTIFPRDWTETAMLGYDDFTPEALKYIVRESLRYVDEKGAGWHEGGIGEYAYTCALRQLPLIDRDMVDIETRYILTFGMFPEIFQDDSELLHKIQRVASYVFQKAKNYSVIHFEEHPRYRGFKAGNWRDSISAYQDLSSCIVTYDTNAVFYPAALRIMQKHADVLNIRSKELEKIISKWQNKKDLFKFRDEGGKSAYALAICDYKNDKSYRKLRVNHTDEAYDLIFGDPSEEDVVSFAKRILDEKYFYTTSGPLIVGKGEGYNSRQYHGEVIWLKQVGLCSMGFRRQLSRNDMSFETKKLIKKVIKYLFHSLIYTFKYLNLLPELIIDHNGAPFLYNDQDIVEGHMNKVQLWSAESARRVIFDYYYTFLKS